MATTVQLLAIFGPMLLTLMGLAIALTTPMESHRAVFAWLIAFVVVGIPTTAAAYFESHMILERNTVDKPISTVTRIEPNQFAARPVLHQHVEHARVTYYGEPREHKNKNHPQAVAYQTVTYQVQQSVAPVVMSNMVPRPKNSSVIPTNTFSCVGFTRNPDGTWEAGDNTQPFNVGKSTDVVVRNQGPIEEGWVTVGGVDLYDLINAKCGKSTAH